MKSSFLCYSNYVPAWQLSSFQITSSLIPSLIFSLLTSSQDHASHVRSVTVSNALPKWHFDTNENKKKDPDTPSNRPHNSSQRCPPPSTRDVGCGGSWGDVALVLAVKWSICRYVGLHHSHPLSHSLLRSPDEQKRLIYSGFKGVAFFSHMTLLPRGVCLSLWIPTKHALMPSLRLTWVNYILLERKKKCCDSLVPTIKEKGKKKTNIYVPPKKNRRLCRGIWAKCNNKGRARANYFLTLIQF